jgi:hypothetical protein
MKATFVLVMRRLLGLSFFGLLALGVSAAVITTRPDPPVVKGAFSDDLDSLEIDFNEDGVVDIRLVTEFGGIDAYFDLPTRIVVTVSLPFPEAGTNLDYGGIGALPIGTVIGNELMGDLDLNRYIWWEGFTNSYDLTQQFGNHEAGVMIVAWGGGGVVASGDVPAKEGVMAVEFYVEGQPHYGYIHFDFRLERGWLLGSGGYIYGWAYESEPWTPITAERIRNGPPVLDFKLTSIEPWPDQSGKMVLRWNAVAGAVYRIEASEDFVTWSDLSGDVVADRDFMAFITAPSPATQRFFRLARVP